LAHMIGKKNRVTLILKSPSKYSPLISLSNLKWRIYCAWIIDWGVANKQNKQNNTTGSKLTLPNSMFLQGVVGSSVPALLSFYWFFFSSSSSFFFFSIHFEGRENFICELILFKTSNEEIYDVRDWKVQFPQFMIMVCGKTNKQTNKYTPTAWRHYEFPFFADSRTRMPSCSLSRKSPNIGL